MIFLSILFTIFSAPSVGAQPSVTDGILINADTMDRDLAKQQVVLDGNVQVVFQNQNLSCSHAVIDLKKQQILATGNVILANEKVHIEGDKVVFNYKQNTGLIYRGFVQSGQVVFLGDVIEKVGDQRYLATNGEYTACETCPPGWSFSGKVIDAEIGGYARIRRPIFRIGGVPILILPGIIVPLKSARQSGFLVPSAEWSGRGGGGIGLSESYFWAINRSNDLTFTPTWYQKLGQKLHADYRYVLAPNSQGQLRAAWIRDEVFQREEYDGKNFDRYFTWYNHHFEMPQGITHRANWVALSDLRYPRDFPDDVLGYGDPAIVNQVSITKASDSSLTTAEADIYMNLLKTDPAAANEDAVHRAPELRYNLKEQEILDSGFFFGLDLNYVNFARTSSSYDDLQFDSTDPETRKRIPLLKGQIQRDGQFDPQVDLWRTGQRLDAKPTLMYPFHIANKFDVLPKLTYRETQYRFNPTESAEASNFSPTAARRYIQSDLFVKTEFSHIYGDSSEKGDRFKHAIEPEIGYSHIPWMRRPQHPFFGAAEGLQYSRQFEFISDTNLNNNPENTGIQFDYEDRTYERRVVDFSLKNILTKKTWTNGVPQYRTAAIFLLNQSYDMNEAQSENSHPWSNVNSLLDARFEHFDTYSTASYNGYAKVADISSRLTLRTTPKNYFLATYARSFSLNDDYTVASETRNVGLGAGLTSRYLDVTGKFEFEAITWRLQSFAYGLQFQPPGHCWLIHFEHRQPIGASPTFKASLNFNFGGEPSSTGSNVL